MDVAEAAANAEGAAASAEEVMARAECVVGGVAEGDECGEAAAAGIEGIAAGAEDATAGGKSEVVIDTTTCATMIARLLGGSSGG